MIRLHLPPTIVMRLPEHNIDVVILTAETDALILCLSSGPPWSAGLSIQDDALDVSRGSLQYGRYLPAPLRNEEGSKELLVLQVRPTPNGECREFSSFHNFVHCLSSSVRIHIYV